MGNFSRDTFDRLKHYVGVRLQQGVPIVDADWNEQEDIRKYELRAFLKWFVGDGVPLGNDGFCIVSVQDYSKENDFMIRGGDGTADGAGRCLVEGWEVVNESDLHYTAQPLYDNDGLAAAWEVLPLPPLTTCETHRVDVVYLDVWEREVDATEDPDHLVNPAIGLETCVRLKREWVVRVDEGSVEGDPAAWAPPPEILREGHVYYPLACLDRANGDTLIEDINDLRRTDLGLAALSDKLQSHLADLGGNPHDVTPEGIGALAASAYEFSNKADAYVVFTHDDEDGAERTIDVGFAPKFVWAVAACNARLGGWDCGASGYGYAEFEAFELQHCTRTEIFRSATTPYWRQRADLEEGLCSVGFFDETVSPRRWNDLGVFFDRVDGSELTVRFSRMERTTGEVAEELESFDVRLYMLILG